MFVNDGVLYAEEPTIGLKVAAARVVNDLSMLVTFSTGETRLFDASSIAELPVYQPLNDQSVFRAFSIDRGVICWADGDIDIAPEKVYSMSYAYDCVA